MENRAHLPEAYLEILNSEGMPLHDYGIHDIALKRASALRALQTLKEARLAILGGDVLRLTTGRPE